MKQLFLICIIIMSFMCCKKEQNLFLLSGKIEGLNDTLYIYRQEETEKKVDTIVARAGVFEYAIEVDTIVPLVMLINDTLPFIVFAEKRVEAKVSGNIALSDLQIEGGTFNNELNDFNKTIDRSKKTISEIKDKVEAFVRTHPLSPVSVHLIEKYFIQSEAPDINRINRIIKYLSGDLQEHYYIKQLIEVADRVSNLEVGKRAPAITGKDKSGKSITFADFADDYLLINFWASWCDSCKKENSVLGELQRKFKKEKFALLGVSLDTNRKEWLEAIERETITWMQITDLGGWNSLVVKQYGVNKLPENILISPQRIIIGKNISPVDLEKKLKELFKQDQP